MNQDTPPRIILPGPQAPPRPKFVMVEQETVLLPKDIAKRVTEEYDRCPYRDKMTRSEFIALLIEAACEHEAKLRDERERAERLVIPAGEYVGRRTGG